ncbi:MAG TPA: PQQ-binding-like beta-propeller repeat protein [Thermoanaerobaculia bacterium]|nr:PQQ-binding-like beta-propeller repeat protein [Thermoanaerobaculia bacterium]
MRTPPFDSTRRRIAVSTLSALAVLAPAVLLGDWPQFGGDGRDFAVADPGLEPAWPEGGPSVAWKRPLGSGYSGISVVGDTLYTTYRQGDDEIVLAASTADGATRWEHRYAAPFTPAMSMEHGDGPHTTPLVVAGRVFVAGTRGRLLALDAATGEVRWTQELIDELGGTPMDRGYASSPIAYGRNVIASVGGPGRGVMAFDRETGEAAWSNGDFDGTYSSPFLLRLGGEDQLVLFTSDSVIGMHPGTGRRLWSHRHRTQFGLNISVPLWVPESDDRGILFVSSAYDGGSRALRLENRGGSTRVEELWAHKQMRLHIGNAIHRDGMVVASNGDFGPVPLTAVDLAGGEILWRDRVFGRANLVQAGEHLLLLDEEGDLGIATVTREGIQVHSRGHVFDTRAWTGPTLVGTRLFARDQAFLVALDLP